MNIDIGINTLWIILSLSLVLLVLILSFGKSKLGSEDDLWTATELCDILAVAMKVPRPELIAMWAQPNRHSHLAQKASDLITSVNRQWAINDQSSEDMSVSVQVNVHWKNGQITKFSGQPEWDDLPQEVRSHFIKSSEPIALMMNLPFHKVYRGES